MGKESYYDILGVSPDADGEEIKAAYRKRAFEYHPDRNQGDGASADRMKVLNEAYAVLADEEKRRQYHNLYRQYGDGAQAQFRQTYSEHDIFNGSDIHQMFEEMARGFGLRGFDEIFKDFHGQGYRQYEFRHRGGFGRAVFGKAGMGGRRTVKPSGKIAGVLIQQLLKKMANAYLPQKGDHVHDVIVLTPELALSGGPYAYNHRTRDKKLVVHIPTGVRNGQQIRLSGMGCDGTHGAEAGDLLLKVKIREPWLDKLKRMIGIGA